MLNLRHLQIWLLVVDYACSKACVGSFDFIPSPHAGETLFRLTFLTFSFVEEESKNDPFSPFPT